MEEISEVSIWNKKRIFAALFLVILLAVGLYFFRTRIFGLISFDHLISVKGVNTKEDNKDFNIQQAVKDSLFKLKQEVSGLDIVEIASSSPQVQKIINDIKALQQIPNNQVKNICKTFCGGL